MEKQSCNNCQYWENNLEPNGGYWCETEVDDVFELEEHWGFGDKCSKWQKRVANTTLKNL